MSGKITPPQLSRASASGAFAAVNDPLGWGFPFTPGLLTQTTARSVSGANWAWYHRVIGGGTITKIGLQVVVQSGNICVAVYRSSGTGRSAVPSTRLATSGSVACPAAGYAEVALGASVDVQAGDWFYLGADNTTATFRAASTSGSSALLGGFSRLQTASAFPAPSPAASSASAADNVFALVGVA